MSASSPMGSVNVLHGKRELCCLSTDLKIEIILDYLSRCSIITSVLKSGGEKQRDGNLRRTQPDFAGFEDRGRSQAVKKWRQPPNAGKSWKMDPFPRAFRKKSCPADRFILAPWHTCQTSNLENCKIINLYCFMPLNLW